MVEFGETYEKAILFGELLTVLLLIGAIVAVEFENFENSLGMLDMLLVVNGAEVVVELKLLVEVALPWPLEELVVSAAAMAEFVPKTDVGLLDMIAETGPAVVEFPFPVTVTVTVALGLVNEELLKLLTVYSYSVSPFGPPQIIPEFPLHGISQRPSVTGAEPANSTFPQ